MLLSTAPTYRLQVQLFVHTNWKLKNKLETYALSFRSNIKEQFNNSNPLPWPPTPDDIEMSNLLDFRPSTLVPFFNLLIEGNADENNRKNTQRVVLSIAQVQQFSSHD